MKRGPSDASTSGKQKKKKRQDELDEKAEEQVEFDFCDPQDQDFHIIKGLVQRMLDGADFDSSEFADLIINEAQVSSAIRCDVDCIGIAALLPLSEFKKALPVKQLLAFWKTHACKAGLEETFNAATEDPRSGILLSERVLNAPAELATPLIAGLVREQQECRDSGDKDRTEHGNVKLILHSALAYIDSGAAPHELGAVPLTSGSTGVQEGAEGELVFMRPEDEFMHARAKWTCQWDTQQDGRFSAHSKRVRVLMAISSAGLKKALKDMASMFNHDLAQHELSL